MKKIFSLIAFVMVVLAANANTPFKNLHVVAKTSPSGAGTVYLRTIIGNDDVNYVRAMSDEPGDEAFIQITLGENNTENSSYGCNNNNPAYLLLVDVEPAEGYELVCLANKIKEDGVYHASDCFAVFDTDNAGIRQTSFDFTPSEYGFMININNINHPVDGESNDSTRNRDVTFANEALWSDKVDTEVYAILRKIGDKKPELDLSDIQNFKDNTTNVSEWKAAVYSERMDCAPGQEIHVPICVKNDTADVAGIEFKVEMGDGTYIEVADEPTLCKDRVADGAMDYYGVKVDSSSVKVAAISMNATPITGNDGCVVYVNMLVPDTLVAGNYDFKIKEVVLATSDGRAVQPGEVTVTINVGDYEVVGIENVNAEGLKSDDRIFRITGVEVKKMDEPGLYIQNGQKIIVR